MRGLVAAAALTLLACGDDTGPLCEAPDPAATPSASRSLTVGDRSGAWSDGQRVPLVYGGQGGIMVVPVVRVAAEPDDVDDTLCVLLTLEHDTAIEEAALGVERLTVLSRDGDAYVSPPIEDFLGFSPSPFIDQELTIGATVVDEAATFEATGAVTLTLAAPE